MKNHENNNSYMGNSSAIRSPERLPSADTRTHSGGIAPRNAFSKPFVKPACRRNRDARSSIHSPAEPGRQVNFNVNTPAWVHSKANYLFSCIVSTMALVVTLPVSVAIAALIVLRGAGPVFTYSLVTGYKGRRFRKYSFNRAGFSKLRIINDDDDSSIEAISELTAIGRFIARHRLDQLPQHFSVLQGYMRVVGTKPDIYPIADYSKLPAAKFDAYPGIIGPWKDEPAESDGEYNFFMDLYYLSRASFSYDIKSVLTYTVF